MLVYIQPVFGSMLEAEVVTLRDAKNLALEYSVVGNDLVIRDGNGSIIAVNKHTKNGWTKWTRKYNT